MSASANRNTGICENDLAFLRPALISISSRTWELPSFLKMSVHTLIFIMKRDWENWRNQRSHLHQARSTLISMSPSGKLQLLDLEFLSQMGSPILTYIVIARILYHPLWWPYREIPLIQLVITNIPIFLGVFRNGTFRGGFNEQHSLFSLSQWC